jgi:hypothetical protein
LRNYENNRKEENGMNMKGLFVSALVSAACILWGCELTTKIDTGITKDTNAITEDISVGELFEGEFPDDIECSYKLYVTPEEGTYYKISLFDIHYSSDYDAAIEVNIDETAQGHYAISEYDPNDANGYSSTLYFVPSALDEKFEIVVNTLMAKTGTFGVLVEAVAPEEYTTLGQDKTYSLAEGYHNRMITFNADADTPYSLIHDEYSLTDLKVYSSEIDSTTGFYTEIEATRVEDGSDILLCDEDTTLYFIYTYNQPYYPVPLYTSIGYNNSFSIDEFSPECRVLSDTDLSTAGVEIIFPRTTNATQYTLYRGTSSSSITDCIATIDSDDVTEPLYTYTDSTALSTVEMYYYKVSAANSESETLLGSALECNYGSYGPDTYEPDNNEFKRIELSYGMTDSWTYTLDTSSDIDLISFINYNEEEIGINVYIESLGQESGSTITLYNQGKSKLLDTIASAGQKVLIPTTIESGKGFFLKMYCDGEAKYRITLYAKNN